MSIDDDMRDAVNARLAALVELHRRRRESAARFNEEKRARRQAGVDARHRRKLAREGAESAGVRNLRGAESAGGARRAQIPPTAKSRDQSPPCPPDRTSRPPGHQNRPPEHPTFRAWLLAHAEKRPRRSGRFLYRLARDAARCHGWNTPDELVQAMETLESGTGHGASPLPAAERVNAAAMLYRAELLHAASKVVDTRGIDDRTVMAPVDPAEGHDNGAAE